MTNEQSNTQDQVDAKLEELQRGKKSKTEDRIAKLLAKAEKTTPEEAAALTEHAERLMLQYGIEQAVINAKRAGKTHAEDEKMMRSLLTFTGVYRKAMDLALYAALREFKTAQLIGGGDDGKTTRLWIAGYQSDVEQLLVLAASLQVQCIAALSTWWKTVDATGWTATQKFKARRQFILSFGEGAGHRIARSRAQAVQESSNSEPGTALALVDRASVVDQWVNEMFNLMPGKSVKMAGGNRASREAGWQAGKNANTGEGALKQTKQLKG